MYLIFFSQPEYLKRRRNDFCHPPPIDSIRSTQDKFNPVINKSQIIGTDFIDH